MISAEIIDQVRERADIVDVVSGYLSLKKTGQNFVGLCPFHQEKTPSFHVSPARQLFYCFGCGVGGTVFHFVMRTEGVSFPQAVMALGEKYGIRIPVGRRREGGEGQEREPLYRVHQEAADYYHEVLLTRQEAQGAREYLLRRGIERSTIERFGLGYSLSSWNDLLGLLVGKGYPPPLLERCGLVCARGGGDGYYDRFRGRLLFPIRDLSGRVIGFGGRALDDSTPKYLNSPETPIFQKGRNLYAQDLGKWTGSSGALIIVEGYFDAIMAHQAGIPAVVATLGTALTPHHVSLIRRFAQKVVLVFDPDLAGVHAAVRCAESCVASGLRVEVVALPPGDDPDSFVRKNGREGFEAIVKTARPLMEFLVDVCCDRVMDSSIEARVQVAQEIFPVLAKLPSPIERGHYLRRIATRLLIGEEDIRAEFGAYVTGGSERRKAGLSLSKRPKEEEIIVHLLLHNAVDSARVRQAIGPEDFADPRLRKILEGVFESGERYQHIRVSEIDQEDQEVLSLLSELSMREIMYEDVDRTVKDCLTCLQRKRLQRRIADLRRRVESAEREKEEGTLRILQQEVSQLARQMATL